MGVVIVAVVLVIGFLYTYNHPPSRYRQKRTRGWNSYFHIAQYGFLFSVVGTFSVLVLMLVLNLLAILVDLVLNYLGVGYQFSSVGTALFTYLLFGHVAVGTLASLIAAALFAYGYAIRRRRQLEADDNAYLQEYTRLAQGDGLESLLCQSMKEGMLVMVTLKSRKVYVGRVEQSRMLNGDIDNLVLIPMLSGYRDWDHLQFFITHNYYNYYNQFDIHSDEGELRLEHFRVVIVAREVDSASLFDLKTYQQFQQARSATSDSVPAMIKGTRHETNTSAKEI